MSPISSVRRFILLLCRFRPGMLLPIILLLVRNHDDLDIHDIDDVLVALLVTDEYGSTLVGHILLPLKPFYGRPGMLDGDHLTRLHMQDSASHVTPPALSSRIQVWLEVLERLVPRSSAPVRVAVRPRQVLSALLSSRRPSWRDCQTCER